MASPTPCSSKGVRPERKVGRMLLGLVRDAETCFTASHGVMIVEHVVGSLLKVTTRLTRTLMMYCGWDIGGDTT